MPSCYKGLSASRSTQLPGTYRELRWVNKMQALLARWHRPERGRNALRGLHPLRGAAGKHSASSLAAPRNRTLPVQCALCTAPPPYGIPWHPVDDAEIGARAGPGRAGQTQTIRFLSVVGLWLSEARALRCVPCLIPWPGRACHVAPHARPACAVSLLAFLLPRCSVRAGGVRVEAC